ncbi:hypothetical protein MTO96_042702 [Rhipicephalus appendiculatus]
MASAKTLAGATNAEAHAMDAETAASKSAPQVAGKRAHEQTVEEKQDASSNEGPPPKAAGARRVTMRSRSIVPMEMRLAEKPPP